MLWTKHTDSFSPQRKPRPCSPAHFEAFLNTDPNSMRKACSCYIAECRISKLQRGAGGYNFWSSVWHGLLSDTTPLSLSSCPSSQQAEEKCAIPLQSRLAPASFPRAAAAAPTPAATLIPTTTPQQANRASYFWMLFQLLPISFLKPYQDFTFIPHPRCFPLHTHAHTQKGRFYKKGKPKKEQHLDQQPSPPTWSVSYGNGQVLGMGQQ